MNHASNQLGILTAIKRLPWESARIIAKFLQPRDRTRIGGARVEDLDLTDQRHRHTEIKAAAGTVAGMDGTGGEGEKQGCSGPEHRNRHGMSPVTTKGSVFRFLTIALGIIFPLSGAVNAQETLTMTVEGEVAPSCSFEFTDDSLTLEGDLPGALSGTASFMVDCNTPFAYSLISANGALAHDGSMQLASTSDMIAGFVPYSVTTTIPLEDGDTPEISDTCDSADILDGVGGCSLTDSGTSIALDKTGTVEISAPATGGPLLAGEYADTLTLTVTVQ